MLGQLAPLGRGELYMYLDQKLRDTVLSDNAGLGIMASLGIKSGMLRRCSQLLTIEACYFKEIILVHRMAVIFLHHLLVVCL